MHSLGAGSTEFSRLRKESRFLNIKASLDSKVALNLPSAATL